MMERDQVVAYLDRLSTQMINSVDGENAFCVSAAAIAVSLDAAEELTDIHQLNVIRTHLIYIAEEVAKLIAAKTPGTGD